MHNESASTLAVRAARADDEPWIVELVPRLHEFGPPAWRTVEQMNAAERADLRNALASLADETTTMLVAVRTADDQPLGFVYAGTQVDFFTGEHHAHIRDLAVAKEGEGQGVGRRLLAAAEEWARSRGHRFITLSVFPENRRAVQLYERTGYGIDVHRMLKLLDPAAE